MSVNKVILVGRLGKDPETRHLDQGVVTTSFPMATSEYYKSKDGQRIEKTEWHNVVTWRGLAEVASKYLKKGSQVFIEGKMRTRSWDDKDGNKRYTTEIVADELRMLDSKRDGEDQGGNYNQSSGAQHVSEPSGSQANAAQDVEDDLPF